MKKKPIEVSHLLAEPKEVKIEIPEGYEIDRENSTFEKIVFKKKNTKPRSWEEYCSTAKEEELRFTIDGVPYMLSYGDVSCEHFKGYFKKAKIAVAFGAMMKLMNLREEWIGDWEPNWNNASQKKANILCTGDVFIVAYFGDLVSRPLSFPTKEMAEDFMNCFKDLLEQAKGLY